MTMEFYANSAHKNATRNLLNSMIYFFSSFVLIKQTCSTNKNCNRRHMGYVDGRSRREQSSSQYSCHCSTDSSPWCWHACCCLGPRLSIYMSWLHRPAMD